MRYKYHKQYRLPNFDYSVEGEYFITICTQDRSKDFGKIENEKIKLSYAGKVVDRIWNKLPEKYKNVVLGVYQVMPDHFHGIIILKPERGKHLINQMPTEFKSGIPNNPMELNKPTIGKMIRWFKGKVKYEIKIFNPEFRWQRRYYDRIIRDEKEFYFIEEYIRKNPSNYGSGILKKYFT